jgi:hypothetical protein
MSAKRQLERITQVKSIIIIGDVLKYDPEGSPQQCELRCHKNKIGCLRLRIMV